MATTLANGSEKPHFGSPEPRIPYSGLKEAFFSKLNQRNHKFFDSGEYFSMKQGIKMPDLLPGGAPPNACPVKREPTVPPQRPYRKLDQREHVHDNHEQLGRSFQHQVSCSDY
ncbi:hypothetical protein DUNSADRAFT_6020 [Dunaliella salina]|uniref:Uncharacterized protein n=1 Tax=Dunaliella salina TaxID=3046 RepID=A0ABQ7GP53_DUNSA|nr:hypothetical protein DUNSADRAFT_6020 [Dunaliella salina]|eukprot:KAF5836384.1 hypothetical protein DUNSADRAFT_6020 [Dunaliella salina]